MDYNIQQIHVGVYLGVYERESCASRPGKGSEAKENEGQAEFTFKEALAHVYRAFQQPRST